MIDTKTLASTNGHAPATVHVSNWSIRRNLVDAALLTLPEDQRGPLRWLDEYAREKNLTPGEVGALLKGPRGTYDGNTVYQIFTGRHKPDNFVRAVASFQQSLAPRQALEAMPFVKTTQARSIISYVEKCQKYRKMGLVFGRNQSGKSASLAHMAAEQPYGQMQVFRVPTNGFLAQLVLRMCIQKKIAVGNSVGELKERLLATFDRSMIVVFDEMHQCYAQSTRVRNPRLDTFEFAREVHDVTGATVILTATPVVLAEMTTGTHSLFFEQLMHRALPPLVLSDLVPNRDLDSFAETIGLDPADGDARTLQDKVIRKEGLGFWLMYLQCARGIADNLKRAVRWDDVATAEREFRRMSRRETAS